MGSAFFVQLRCLLLDSLVTWAAARQVEQRPATATDLLRAVQELSATLPAAVLDSRPQVREMTDTSDVPQMTTSLEEVASALDHGPRTFPPASSTRATRTLRRPVRGRNRTSRRPRSMRLARSLRTPRSWGPPRRRTPRTNSRRRAADESWCCGHRARPEGVISPTRPVGARSNTTCRPTSFSYVLLQGEEDRDRSGRIGDDEEGDEHSREEAQIDQVHLTDDLSAARGAVGDRCQDVRLREVLSEPVGFAGAMVVAAARDQQVMAGREVAQTGAFGLVVLAVIDLDAVQPRLDHGLQQVQRQGRIRVTEPGWAMSATPPAAWIACTASTGEGA